MTSVASLPAQTPGGSIIRSFNRVPDVPGACTQYSTVWSKRVERVAKSIKWQKQTNVKVTDQINSESMQPKPICMWEVWAGRLLYAGTMRSYCSRPWTPDENPFCIDAAQHTENWSLWQQQQQALCAPAVSNTVQPAYRPIRICMTANSAESHCPKWRSWWLRLFTRGFKHVQQKDAYSSRRNTVGGKVFSWGTSSVQMTKILYWRAATLAHCQYISWREERLPR